MSEKEFLIEVEKLGVKITNEQKRQFSKYMDLLIFWNEKYNLTTIIENNEIYLKHFFDSSTLIKSKKIKQNITFCDVGTGAGFPGLVVKILFPSIDVTLIESSNKKCFFLNEIIKKLNLKKIKVLNIRAEDHSKKNREKYDIVSSRAVARLNVLSELCMPLVKKGGLFIAMKANLNNEKEEAKNAINKLGGKIDKIIEFELFNNSGKRTLIIIVKENKTNLIYPRSYSHIKKNPLK